MLPRILSLLRLHTLENFSKSNTSGIGQTVKRSAAHAHRTSYSMDKVYLRNAAESQELHISFRYVNTYLRVDREFNFCRSMNEKVDGALARISTNIVKELVKRSRKGKNRQSQSLMDLPDADSITEIPVEIRRAVSNNKVTDITFEELLSGTTNDLLLTVLDSRFQIVLNQPWVMNLVLPTTILAGFAVYPTKAEMQFAERQYCTGAWFKAQTSTGDVQKITTWLQCGNGFCYNSTNDDIGYYLKFVLTPGNAAGQFGPPVENITKKVVQAGPGMCPFETRHCFTKQRLAGNEMRVVSYNLLADLYSDSDYSRTQLFPYCPPYALKIDYRKQLFLKELLGFNADIICLQEVDLKIFDLDLKPMLGAHQNGYRGILAEKGTCGEGIATFYRDDRYTCESTYQLNIGENIPVLPEFSDLWQRINKNVKLAERICDRSTTLQLNLLKCKENDRYLLVANTHLYFHPDADHIRLLQIAFSMLYVEHIYKKTLAKLQLEDEKRLALIFCGDFNSVPECGIFKLMTEKYVDSDFIDWSSNAEEAVTNVSIAQPFNMQSACGTPTYTNYTQLFAACLDYIFYQSDRLEVQQVIPLPTDEELKAHIAIPSVVFPSDHVALVADLKFK